MNRRELLTSIFAAPVVASVQQSWWAMPIMKVKAAFTWAELEPGVTTKEIVGRVALMTPDGLMDLMEMLIKTDPQRPRPAYKVL